ncbi:lactonase family protein [Mariniradius sediminis]|uniref:Lactonase family protein n=1 Tax=Mariniradius sediminis TaxID=2909237 RepID=A0ABS9BW48_9BACT|nr:lactonase family protein [Mariniradius sediminis]MCF1751662.1 lactonase family protein [Mariniradius sediminis]
MENWNKQIVGSILVALCLTIACDNKPQEEKVETSYSFLIGAYTDNDSQGIGLLNFDPKRNVLDFSVLAPGIQNPSFVIANNAQTLIYTVEETAGENGGKVKSFRFDRQNNSLEQIDVQDTKGDHPCYLAMDEEERFLVVGNYSGGNFSTFKIDGGKLIPVQTIQHEGQSINIDRQEKAHVHSTVFHPDGKYLLVGDLGTDKIHIYKFNPSFAVPFNHSDPAYFEVAAGSGPRHLAIHPNGSRVYLVHELTAEIGAYSFENGQVGYVASFPLTANDFVGNVSAAEVRISPDARNLYVSNRGDANEISVFKILGDGNLEWVERVKTGGEMPRNFILTKDGKYLLAAHQASNNITVFERNVQTGKLTKLPFEAKINKPVYFFGLD